MELDPLAFLRRIRHILTGWLLVFVTGSLYLIPAVGVPLTFVFAAVSFLYVLRIFAYGHPFQGLILTLLLGSTCVTLLVFPEMVASSRSMIWASFRDASDAAESAEVHGPRADNEKPRPTFDSKPAGDGERSGSWRPPDPERLNTSILDRSRDLMDLPELSLDGSSNQSSTSSGGQGPDEAYQGGRNTSGTDRARPKTSEEEVLEIILKCREAEQCRDISGAMAPYKSRVFYFGKSQMWKDIRADKLDYFQKWPKISESIVGERKVESLPQGYSRVSFRSTFRVINPETRKWCAGTIDNEYLLLLGSAGWRITSQKGEVSNLQKGTF